MKLSYSWQIQLQPCLITSVKFIEKSISGSIYLAYFLGEASYYDLHMPYTTVLQLLAAYVYHMPN